MTGGHDRVGAQTGGHGRGHMVTRGHVNVRAGILRDGNKHLNGCMLMHIDKTKKYSYL